LRLITDENKYKEADRSDANYIKVENKNKHYLNKFVLKSLYRIST